MNTKSLNIFIYTFAIIGLVSILSSFNTKSETHSTPESHVWEIESPRHGGGVTSPVAYLYNKQTGEVYKLNTLWKTDAKDSNEVIRMDVN